MRNVSRLMRQNELVLMLESPTETTISVSQQHCAFEEVFLTSSSEWTWSAKVDEDRKVKFLPNMR